jgi:hypothetical protein
VYPDPLLVAPVFDPMRLFSLLAFFFLSFSCAALPKNVVFINREKPVFDFAKKLFDTIFCEALFVLFFYSRC